MNLYPIALFAHIVGVIILFTGMGLQWLTLFQLRRAQSVKQVREWSGIYRTVGRLSPISAVLILAAGIYMMAVLWSLTTVWILISLAAMVVMMILGMGVSGRRVSAIRRLAAGEPDDGALSVALRTRLADVPMWVSAQMAAFVALSIVFMMTTKPDLVGSLLALMVSLLLGGIVGVVSAGQSQGQQPAPLSAQDA